jgi:hypothetical protein
MSANLDIRRFGTPEEELALLGAARIACSRELQSLLISAAKSANDSANFRSLSMM